MDRAWLNGLINSMITVTIPDVSTTEVSYTFHCIFKEFLGLDYQIKTSNVLRDFKIELGNNTLIIRNHFFHSEDILDYYRYDNIPKTISKGSINVLNNKYPLVSLFGNVSLEKKDSSYHLNADIISSTYFMLSRWEEYANKERDAHNRFPASQSLAFRERFVNRPIINEYVELLWAMLQQMGCTQKRKERTFKLVPTHDVDYPFLWYNFFQKINYVGWAFVKKRNLSLSRYYASNILRNKDPFDKHDYLMDLSEKAGEVSYHFFLVNGTHKEDSKTPIEHKLNGNLIKHILDRGHKVGFHPSYKTPEDTLLFKEEKTRLEAMVDTPINTGRHHFLRYNISTTPRLWDDNNMAWDSTLGYADWVGFRCGVCYPYPMYDLLNRRMLTVMQRPLIVMDQALKAYMQFDVKESVEVVNKLNEEVRKYNGEFVFLWHNSSFDQEGWAEYTTVLNTLYD